MSKPKNSIRILIPTPITPPKKDFFMTAMDNVIPFLTRENDVQIIWLVHQPLRIKNPQDNVKDIHDYPDAKNLLESVRPNCIMVNPTYEPITYSISLAANFLKIPLVCTYLYDHQFTMREESHREYFQYAASLFRRFFSGGVPTDSEEEKRFFGRGRFMIYKYQFLIKTKMILGIDFFSITRELVKDIIMFLSKSNPEYNILADLNLLPNNSWYEPLIKLGFPSKKLSITGNPFWDIRYQKMQQRQSTREQNGKTRVLVLTDALVEHGLWTRDERDLYLTRVLSDLKRENDITFALKIHPSSENIDYYKSLLPKLGINAPIYQSEDLWDIINEFDLVLSYGQTFAHTELSCGLVKLILLDPKHEFISHPLINEGVDSGHVLKCDNFDDLVPSIRKLATQRIELTGKFIKEREKLFSQFDGKAGERVASEILKICLK